FCLRSATIVFLYNTLFLFGIVTFTNSLQYFAHVGEGCVSLWTRSFLGYRLSCAIAKNIKIRCQILIAETNNQFLGNRALLNCLFYLRNLTADFSNICTLFSLSKYRALVALEDRRPFMRPYFNLMSFSGITV